MGALILIDAVSNATVGAAMIMRLGGSECRAWMIALRFILLRGGYSRRRSVAWDAYCSAASVLLWWTMR